MINSFLVSLQNSGTQPVNASSTTGDVLWPSPVEVKEYSGAAAQAELALFNGQFDNFARFLISIQLLWVVEESVLANTIQDDDPRITYTTAQLSGQFEAQTDWEQQTSRALQSLSDTGPLEFLEGDPLLVYRSSLSPMDKLAAVICHFGARND